MNVTDKLYQLICTENYEKRFESRYTFIVESKNFVKKNTKICYSSKGIRGQKRIQITLNPVCVTKS